MYDGGWFLSRITAVGGFLRDSREEIYKAFGFF